MEWVFTFKSLYGRAVRFTVLLSTYHLKNKRISGRDVDFLQLLQASIAPTFGLDESLAYTAPCSNRVTVIRLDPELLYARVSSEFSGFVMSFDGSSKTAKHGVFGGCAQISWKLSEWSIVMAASDYIPSTIVNLAEYAGMHRGAQAALDHQVTDLTIVDIRG